MYPIIRDMEHENIVEEKKENPAVGSDSGAKVGIDAKTDAKNETRKRYIRNICYIGLFAALLAVCAWLYIPIPASEIAVTLQTLGVCAVAGLLGWKRGTLCILVYILLGICGIPVFSGYNNFYALLGAPSAGYVIGFVFTAFIVGIVSDKLHLIGEKASNKVGSQILQLIVLAVAMIAGVAVCYVFGTLWYLLIYKGSVTAENLQIALTYCVYPFIVPDLIKIVVATVLVNRLKKYVR